MLPYHPVHTTAWFQFSYERNQTDWDRTVLTPVYTAQCIRTITTRPNCDLRFIVLLNNRPESCLLGRLSERSITACNAVVMPLFVHHFCHIP